MNKCFLDANVFVYFKDKTSDKHNQTVNLLRDLAKNGVKIYTSSLCLDETIHALQFIFIKLHRLKTSFVKLRSVFSDILDIPNLELINPPPKTEGHKKVIDLMETYSLRPRDAYHLLTMQFNNIDGFATFDNDFHKVFKGKLLQKA